MFRKIDDRISVFGQIRPEDVATAAAQGFTTIVNNRPEEEEAGQPAGDTIKAAAKEAGLAYVAIPITHAGFSIPQVDAMRKAIANADGPILAFCRSGTRSTLLWALASAADGADPEEVARKAAAAGYDVSPVRPFMAPR
ncbi:TIGR01244 family sulfur transferase [Sphingomonas montanisoli]|uniref:TIGR01244 family phosphatase n=1 Tax=Sphingomonas montanisoli TaxID=2606412 RepID=A0A5D9C2G8_9SPHN|nr:TIGR01244 family sulfur transferase [Sphingomonas montanisoli]TZG26058.1 TIGR01244 family phosphatase [Sphingomonas montanisoli]